MIVLSCKIPEDLMEEIDRLVAEEARRARWKWDPEPVSRSKVARRLLETGINAWRAEQAKEPTA